MFEYLFVFKSYLYAYSFEYGNEWSIIVGFKSVLRKQFENKVITEFIFIELLENPFGPVRWSRLPFGRS